MLYDRPYMRSQPGDDGGSWRAAQRYPVLTWLLVGTIFIYFLQHIFLKIFDSNFLMEYFELSRQQLSQFRVWTFITYGFLHDLRGFFHIFVNMLGLFFMGRILEPVMGSRLFGTFYLSAILVGGLSWLLASATVGLPAVLSLVGASAGVLACLFYFCLLFPERQVTMLLFFIIPITLKPKYVMWFLLITEGLGLMNELSGGSGFYGNIAHSAHIGGMLTAYLFYKLQNSSAASFSTDGRKRSSTIGIEPPRWFQNRKTRSTSEQKFKVNVVTRQDMEAEVNRILDKINREGFGALTLKEKETLDRARDYLRK